MADYAVTIAKLTKLVADVEGDPTLLQSLQEMGERAEEMIRVALDSFANRDLAAAESLVDLDELIDRSNRRFVERVVEIVGEPGLREWVLRMVLVSRTLERIGDHAVDIGEQVSYLLTARVPRVHGRLASRAARLTHRLKARALIALLPTLALVGCGGSGSSGESGSLVGAGSTLVAPLVAQWSNDYSRGDDHLRRDRLRRRDRADHRPRGRLRRERRAVHARPGVAPARIASSCPGRSAPPSPPTTSRARRRSSS